MSKVSHVVSMSKEPRQSPPSLHQVPEESTIDDICITAASDGAAAEERAPSRRTRLHPRASSLSLDKDRDVSESTVSASKTLPNSLQIPSLEPHAAIYLCTVEKSLHLRTLLAMALGIEHDIDDRFTSVIKKGASIQKSYICCTSDILKTEITRRLDLRALGWMDNPNQVQKPQPKNWNNTKCEKWLKENPLQDDESGFVIKKLGQIVKNLKRK